MMSFFNPPLPLKKKEITHHPWERRIQAAHSHKYKYGHNSVENPICPSKKAKIPQSNRIKFIVIGNRVSKEFIYCLYLVKGLHKYKKKKFDAPVIRGVSSVEWPKAWNDLKLEFGPVAYCLKSQVAVLMNDKLLGGENELKDLIESKYDYHLSLDYFKEGIQQFIKFVKSNNRPYAYMHLTINGETEGTFIFMLYADLLPNTCKNFLQYCEATKGGYAGTPVHRIVKDAWIQCGGFALKKNNKLDCENFIVPHDRRGVLCMANDGRHIDCSTQFFILLQPAPWMKHKYVAFGQLVEGEKTLRKIEDIPTWYESPLAEIIIYKAGVFNLDCHDFPINKSTNAYLDGHVDDLIKVGEMLREVLYELLFAKLEERRLELEEEALDDVTITQDVQTTKKSPHHKEDTKKVLLNKDKTVSKTGNRPTSSITATSDLNNDFDVDVYDYEFEDYSYFTDISAKVASVLSEKPPKPERPYYIAFTDVPYPGEVDSAFDLQKLLKGDYCLTNDLEEDRAKRKRSSIFKKRITIPEALLDALFDYFTEDFESDSSKSSLHSADKKLISNFISENSDSVSFAGPIIRKMANVSEKYKVFDDAEGENMKAKLLTDDQLRLTRMATNEYLSHRNKMVSINLSSSKLSHTKIRRQQTGFIRPVDLLKLRQSSLILGHDEDDFYEEEDEYDREMRIVATYSQGDKSHPCGSTRPHHLGSAPPRQSVLARLLDDVASDSDDEEPTLKDYKPHSEAQERSYLILTKSSINKRLNDGPTEMNRPPTTAKRSIQHALDVQHGKKIYRKLSSDYVKTIDDAEKQANSLRSLEYAKRRPSISVSEYQMKNQKHSEELKAKSVTTTPSKLDAEKTQ